MLNASIFPAFDKKDESQEARGSTQQNG